LLTSTQNSRPASNKTAISPTLFTFLLLGAQYFNDLIYLVKCFSSIHLYTHTFTPSSNYPHTPSHPLIHPHTQSSIHPSIPSTIQSYISLPTHSLNHPYTHRPNSIPFSSLVTNVWCSTSAHPIHLDGVALN